MSTNNEINMFEVAKSLAQLNTAGRVKGFSSHEKGYARVLDIKRGCSIFVHHLRDNALIINLRVTPTAHRLYAKIVTNSISIFEKSFSTKVQRMEWEHVINGNQATIYYVDVSDMSLEKIQEKLGQIMANFGAAA